MRGTIVKIIHIRGFGFIDGEDGVSRYFHATAVVPERFFPYLNTGDLVDFDPTTIEAAGNNGNGERATNVRKVIAK